MSERKTINWEIIKTKYLLNWKNWLFSFVFSLFVIPFIFIFTSINRTWADGMSVAAIFYIGISILVLIFKEAKFETWKKLKNLFTIKKENNEPFTKFEKTQMSVLNIDQSITKKKKNTHNNGTIMIAIVMILYGIILLCVSLPFIF